MIEFPTFYFASPSQFDFEKCKKDLESQDTTLKTKALQSCIIAIGNNDEDSVLARSLLVSVIRYAMPSKDKVLKKLVLLYLENIRKCEPDGQLKSEMILVCNGIRNDLQHPNEYYRGCALRFLGRLHEAEILEPLIPSIRSSLVYFL